MYDEVLDRLVPMAEALKVGPAGDFESDLGPLISAAQIERVQGYVKIGLDQGARLVTGGEVLTDGELAKGHFHAPTIFADVTNDMTIAQEEIFGPVLSVIGYDGDSEASRSRTTRRTGCQLGLVDQHPARGRRGEPAAQRRGLGQREPRDERRLAPFGGYKQSGVGRELGSAGIDAYLETKHVHVDQTTTLAQRYWYGILGLGD